MHPVIRQTRRRARAVHPCTASVFRGGSWGDVYWLFVVRFLFFERLLFFLPPSFPRRRELLLFKRLLFIYVYRVNEANERFPLCVFSAPSASLRFPLRSSPLTRDNRIEFARGKHISSNGTARAVVIGILQDRVLATRAKIPGPGGNVTSITPG